MEKFKMFFSVYRELIIMWVVTIPLMSIAGYLTHAHASFICFMLGQAGAWMVGIAASAAISAVVEFYEYRRLLRKQWKCERHPR